MYYREVKIREARIEDAELIAAAERDIAKVPGRLASRPHELKDESVREKITQLSKSQNGRYVLAEVNGEVVGHAFLDPEKLEVMAHVVDLTLAIHEGHQGRGYGELLLSHLIDWARSNPQVEKIGLHVRSSNLKAIKLYEKMGFVVEGLRVRMIKIGPNQYLDNIAMALWVG